MDEWGPDFVKPWLPASDRTPAARPPRPLSLPARPHVHLTNGRTAAYLETA